MPIPLLISSDERPPGINSPNYACFGFLAIKSIQEQQALIEAQKTRMNQLHTQIQGLGARLERPEAIVRYQ